MNDLLTAADYVSVGYIGGLHGYDGSVRLVLDTGMENLMENKTSFLYFKEEGMFVPRFIRSWNVDQSLICFERIPSREEARRLTDQKVYLRKRDLPDATAAGEASARRWNLMSDYQIYDVEQDKLVGPIHSIEEFPGGWMAEVQKKDQADSILIPLAAPLIDRIDEKSKIVYMKLPEGLVEL